MNCLPYCRPKVSIMVSALNPINHQALHLLVIKISTQPWVSCFKYLFLFHRASIPTSP